MRCSERFTWEKPTKKENSRSRSIGYWARSNRVRYSIQDCFVDCLFITRDVFVQLLDIFFLNLVFSLIVRSTDAPQDLCFHWPINKQSLLLFLGVGVLFVLIHLLFRSSITDHVKRATDLLLINRLLQVNRIPNKQKASLLSGKRGCFILKFSHNGRYNHRWNWECFVSCLAPRPRFSARPMRFRSRGPSKFLAVCLGYVTEMRWLRRPGKTS